MIRSLLDPYLSQTLDQYGATPPLAAKPPGPGLLGGSFGRGPGGNSLTGFGREGTLNVNRSDSASAPGAPNNVGTLPPTEPSVAFRNALLAGGQAAARAPAYDSVGSSLASALANGLTSGAQSFVATRDAEKDRDAQMAQLKAWRESVAQLDLPTGVKRVAANLGPKEGMAFIQSQAPEFSQGAMGVVQTKGAGAGGVSVAAPEKVPSSQAELAWRLGQPGLSSEAKDSIGKAYLALGEKPNPQDMSASDNGIARSVGLNPNKIDEWSEQDTIKFRNAMLETAKSGASNVNVGGSGENKAGRAAVVEQFSATRKEIELARRDQVMIDQQLKLLDDGISSGSGAGVLQTFRNAASRITGYESPTSANMQAYVTLGTARALPYARALAPVTKEDLERLILMKAGDAKQNAKTLRTLLANDMKINAIREQTFKAALNGPQGALLGDPELVNAWTYDIKDAEPATDIGGFADWRKKNKGR